MDQQKQHPVFYEGQEIGRLTPDLIVDDAVIGDPKVASAFNDTHVAQMIGYLAITDLQLALLLNFKEEERRQIRRFSLITGLISVVAITAVFARAFLSGKLRRPPPMPAVAGGTQPLGELLFSQYLLPFEVVSVLLLVAMIGTVLLSKRTLE